jgi:hypothetical protein
MICPDVENAYIESRSRGGLVKPSQNLVQVFEVVENLFREFIQKQTSVVKSIPCEKLCNDALVTRLAIVEITIGKYYAKL